ncbi:MAG: hypothetical protein NC308_00235 [Clostridium sp.]|nr:hypothetical protein [Bacteroides sp.]MCM1197294.1 hypothetical protein [Clostridium sp.]
MKATEDKGKSRGHDCNCTPDTGGSRRKGHVVTQLTPDDLMTDSCLGKSRTGPDGEPTAQQLNQEVTAINPSVESMDGRG